jgi:TPR repeat protein
LQVGISHDHEAARLWWYRAATPPRIESVRLSHHCKETLEQYIQIANEIGSSNGSDDKKDGVDVETADNICFIIGRCYYEGIGTTINKKKALEWWNQGLTEAKNTTSKCNGWCAFAIGTLSEDISLRVKWLTKSMEYGNVLAAQQLANIYSTGAVGKIEKDERKAFELMKWSAEQSLLSSHQWIGNAPLKLAAWYYEGICTPKDYIMAVKWLTIASNQPNGNGQSDYNIGLIYQNGGYGIEKDEKEAFKWYLEGVQRGNATAQYNIANRYRNGDGVDKDNLKAFEWMLQSAQQGYVHALYEIGLYYRYGIGTSIDYMKAIQWWKNASQHNGSDGNADNEIGIAYEHKKDVKDAFEWYLKGAQRGSPAAQYNLAICYPYGNGHGKDEKKAFEWMVKSAQQNYIPAVNKIGNYYRDGIGTSIDYALAMEWHEKASQHDSTGKSHVDGTGNADNSVGWAYENGNGVEKDAKVAYKWYSKGAQRGSPAAQYNLAICYRNGDGIAKDDKKAFEWMLRSAKQYYTSALYSIGCYYSDGIGTSIDYVKAVEWWVTASLHEDSNGNAENNLGWAYKNGKGVVNDEKEAFKWYLKGAERGNAVAQYNLAIRYRNGNGTTKNEKKSFEWMLRSAEQNDSDAIYEIGLCYHEGIGTSIDYVKAMKWWMKASLGHACNADNNIGSVYSKGGNGVEKNVKQAYKWYLSGAERGSAGAQYNLATCYRNGNGIEKNEAKAFEWMLKSAEQNYTPAVYSIGYYYRDGIGIHRNYSKYLEWYEMESIHPPRDSIAELACKRCSCSILNPIEDTFVLNGPSLRVRASPMPMAEWNEMRSIHFEFGGRLHVPHNGENTRVDGSNAPVYIARLRQPLSSEIRGRSGGNSYEEYPLVVKCIFNYDAHAKTTRTLMVCIQIESTKSLIVV